MTPKARVYTVALLDSRWFVTCDRCGVTCEVHIATLATEFMLDHVGRCGRACTEDEVRLRRAQLTERIAANKDWLSKNWHLGKEPRRSCQANIEADERELATLTSDAGPSPETAFPGTITARRGDHTYQAFARDGSAFHSGSLLYRVTCATCGAVEVHPATTSTDPDYWHRCHVDAVDLP